MILPVVLNECGTFSHIKGRACTEVV